MKRAIIISDGKAGHVNQSIALSRHLGLDFVMLNCSYPTGAAKVLSYIFDKLNIRNLSFFAHDFKSLPEDEEFGIIISTGSTTYYPNKMLAKKLGIPNVAVLYPKSYRLDFSHIICPEYDHPPKQENITTIPLNLCAADTSFFDEAVVEFKTKHQPQKKSVGIIIGGSNAVSEINLETLKVQLEQIFELTKDSERWVTTSRRTPSEVVCLIEEFDFDYKLIASRESYNPIPAFIATCERIFVTSDSASMVSECVSFGDASVEVLITKQLKTPNKFEELIQGLADKKAIHVFDGTLGDAKSKIDLGPILRESLSSLYKK